MSITFQAIDAHRVRRKVIGGETVEFPTRLDLGDAHFLNLANENARLLLLALGLAGDGTLWGTCTLPKMRRHIMVARATGTAARYTRAPELRYGAPVHRGDGVIELRPVRVCSGGLDEADLTSRIDRLAALTAAADAHGATHIDWG